MVTVDSKGRIVLPQEVRERLGITAGTEVEVHEENGKAVVEPEDEPSQVIEKMEQLIEETAAESEGTTPVDGSVHPVAQKHRDAVRRGAGQTAMSDAGGPYLFDVGVVALAHTDAPVRDVALSYVRDAIAGEIDAVVPYPAIIGAHTVLTTYYGRTNADASRLLRNFMDAKRVHWYDRMPDEVVRTAFENARTANVGGWDGYYAQVAIEEGVNTVLTIDDDFERFDAFETEVILTSGEFNELNDFLEN